MSICENEILLKILKYLIITSKYAVPSLLILLGIIKLIAIRNKHKAKKRLAKYLLIAIITFLVTILIEMVILNMDNCISCNMKNNCEINNEKPITPSESNSNDTNTNELEQTESVTSTTKQPTSEIIDGITYVDGIMIVNKTYSIPSTYAPENAGNNTTCNTCLTNETLSAFKSMQADATAIGLNIYISSGYRSYSHQERIYNNYVKRDGKQKADTYSARPGHSEHQTGLAFDLNTIDDSFANTAEGKWIQENCWRYGLILRYPKGKEKETGYQYESWHLRYVGKKLAEELYNNGTWLTLEEYFNLTSEYNV